MNKKCLIYTAILIIVALFYHLLTFNQGINLLDDGLLTHATERIADGEVLYKEVFTIYPPGMYLSLMFFFKMFGASILTLKIMKLFFLLITIPVLYYLSKLIIKNKLALIPPLLIIFYSSKIPYSRHFFIYLSFFLLIWLYKQRSKLWTFIPGLSLGIAGIFSHEFGFAAIISSFIFITLSQSYHLFDRKKYLKEIGLFLFGILIPVVPLLLYFYSNTALTDFFYNLVYYPLRIYPAYHSLSFPSIFAGLPNILLWVFRKGLIFYLPFLIYSITSLYLILKVIRKQVTKNIKNILLIFIFGLLSFKLVFSRSDLPHLWQTLIPVYILSMFFISKLLNRYKKLAGLLLILPLLFILQFPVYQVIYQPNQNNVLIDLPKAQVYEEPVKAEAVTEIVDFIQKNTKQDDYILVVPYETAFYFLTGRQDPTTHMTFLPGYPDKEYQEELIKTFKNIKYVIYGHGWDVDNKKFRDYAEPIHNYIESNYYVVKNISHYEILKRK